MMILWYLAFLRHPRGWLFTFLAWAEHHYTKSFHTTLEWPQRLVSFEIFDQNNDLTSPANKPTYLPKRRVGMIKQSFWFDFNFLETIQYCPERFLCLEKEISHSTSNALFRVDLICIFWGCERQNQTRAQDIMEHIIRIIKQKWCTDLRR